MMRTTTWRAGQLLAATVAAALTAACASAAVAQLGGKPTDCIQPGGCGGTTRPGGVEARPSDQGNRRLRSLRSAKPPAPAPQAPAAKQPNASAAGVGKAPAAGDGKSPAAGTANQMEPPAANQGGK